VIIALGLIDKRINVTYLCVLVSFATRSGPYGSYSSISAAKAGIFAAQPAPSKRPEQTKRNFFETVFKGRKPEYADPTESSAIAKQGILNLYTLLKARYTSVAAKRQLAILFAFISSPSLQPTTEIAALLGEADNTTVSIVEIIRPLPPKNDFEPIRTSSRRGGGYSIDSFPKISIDPPPALGDIYKAAVVKPVMRTTSRVLRIDVVDGGDGYDSAPQVRVVQRNARRPCVATAIVDREGHVDSVVVLDPGLGYGGKDTQTPPQIQILAPSKKGKDPKEIRVAKAVAVLEYELADLQLESGGNGYAKTEPPKISISPPESDPDWFLAIQEQPELRMVPVTSTVPVEARVEEMKFADGNIAFSTAGGPIRRSWVEDDLLDRLRRDPLELLPSSIRPEKLLLRRTKQMLYGIPSLDDIPQYVVDVAPRFRAVDPVFGSVGKVPVSRGASELKPDEYARLALSGAVCTVLVRTALNPLELIKTKQQLLNDEELLDFARSRKTATDTGDSDRSKYVRINEAVPPPAGTNRTADVAVLDEQATVVAETSEESATKKEKLGTPDLIRSLVELRGVQALFQSADITFLASIMFGSFGFGATELFRRSFTAIFFSNGDADSGSELVLLLAASVATVVTAAAAAPFELLRVRSMGLLESTGWTEVLRDFLAQQNDDSPGDDNDEDEFDLRKLKPRELLPLWSGFSPVLSRELAFAIPKFLTFDLIAKTIVAFLNSRAEEGALPIQVGVGPLGLAISAAGGAVAGIAGAIVSHPADLILTKTSARGRKKEPSESAGNDWRDVVKDLIGQEGGIANLFVGLGARSTFFFLVIGLQFFLYDYVKNLFQVGSDDLSLVLDVFYAVRAGLVGVS